jgi:hypothetical protein
MDPRFVDAVRAAFPSAPAVTLGAPRLGATVHPEPLVTLPLAMVNRHGLIAGATGTGKTKTLQLLAEQLSSAGVPVFLADVKGDLAGLAAVGGANDRVAARAAATGVAWRGAAAPVAFWSLTGRRGAQLRATVSSFGPLLLAKVLGLNDTQTSVLTLVFKYCDDRGLVLLDFADLRAVLRHLTGDGAADLAELGAVPKATVGVLLRELVELEQQGADELFGEPELDLDDLLHVDAAGRGRVGVLELADVQDRPRLFSTFLMWLLVRLYHELPEVGDVDKPKLVFFFDEAHLLFDGASRAFTEQVERVVRLVRSKGVGIFFVTQHPRDVPTAILGQLGHRIQHALRAFTPEDEKALKAAARTMPTSRFYAVEETLTQLATGEALVSVLSPQGVPTSPFVTMMAPPSSRMGPLEEGEWASELRSSELVRHYGATIDRESARELLAQRLAPPGVLPTQGDDPAEPPAPGAGTSRKGRAESSPRGRRAPSEGAASRSQGGAGEPSLFDEILSSSVTKTVAREVTRGLLGALLGTPPRRRRRSLW